MALELSRRSLFKGLLAASALRFIPAVPLTSASPSVVSRTLNPFSTGNSSRLTEMVLAGLDQVEKEKTIAVVRSIPSFRIEMLDDIGGDESVSEALTQHLGDGEWSEWAYSADDVRRTLSSLDRKDQLHLEAVRYFSEANVVSAVEAPEMACKPLSDQA